jgi:hypothetical protein
MKLSLRLLLIIGAITATWHINAMKRGDHNTPITIVNISDQEIWLKDEVSGGDFKLPAHSSIQLPERHSLKITWKKDAKLYLAAHHLTGEALVIDAGKKRFGEKHWFGSSLEARIMTLQEVQERYPESISAQ